jgi:hypothetical protein
MGRIPVKVVMGAFLALVGLPVILMLLLVAVFCTLFYVPAEMGLMPVSSS